MVERTICFSFLPHFLLLATIVVSSSSLFLLFIFLLPSLYFPSLTSSTYLDVSLLCFSLPSFFRLSSIYFLSSLSIYLLRRLSLFLTSLSFLLSLSLLSSFLLTSTRNEPHSFYQLIYIKNIWYFNIFYFFPSNEVLNEDLWWWDTYEKTLWRKRRKSDESSRFNRIVWPLYYNTTNDS